MIDNSWYLWVIFMLYICCLFIGIDKMRILWHPTIFEFEEECLPQGQGRKRFW